MGYSVRQGTIMKLLFLFLSFLFTQGLNINEDIYSRISKEFYSIKDQKISENIFIYPNKEIKQKDYYDLHKSKNLHIYPVLGLRYSSSGFEINQDISNGIFWLSPGIEFRFNQILVNVLNPIWFNGTVNFYKHSAYGLDNNLSMGSTIGNEDNQSLVPIFFYNNNYQYGFYKDVQSDSSNGVDFDESLGYASILSKDFDITIGKFKSSLGPSVYSNLVLSHTIPAFNQFRVKYSHDDKFFFTFIIGDLHSNLIDSSYVYEDGIFDNKYPLMQRRIFNHRIDFNITKNLRVGFYEQIIGLANNSGLLAYINPFQIYWSEQHQNNDLDNLQMGFDFDFLFNKSRLYGGLLVDEWAPYDTFNSNAHNWFAKQIGFSRIFQIENNKIINGILKFEYSSAEPQVYTHKFDINIPAHHNYPIGLWSGGDSIDKRLSCILFIMSSNQEEEKIVIDFTYQNTKFGEPVYQEGVSLLSSNNIKVRDLLYCQIKKTLFYNIDYYFKVGYYKTVNLYSEDNFLDISMSLLYNIQN